MTTPSCDDIYNHYLTLKDTVSSCDPRYQSQYADFRSIAEIIADARKRLGIIDSQKLSVKTKKMNLSNLAKKLLSPDIRTLVDGGYLDGELDITNKGVELVALHYLQANLADLAKLAKEEMKEEEKED